MNKLFDRAVLEAAISVALVRPDLVPALLHANGTTLEDCGSQQHADVLQQLKRAHEAGEKLCIEVLASRLAESSSYPDRDGWMRVLDEIRQPRPADAFPMFLMRLSSLRFRRQLVTIAFNAQHDTLDKDLTETVSSALDQLERAGMPEPLTTFNLAQEPQPPPRPLVGDSRQQLVMPREAIVLASDPGVGKTKLLSEIALSVASGQACLGWPTVQQPVVFVTSDGDPDLLRNLQRQWASRSNRVPLDSLPLHVHSEDDFCLEERSCLRRLRSTIERAGGLLGPVLLILESLATNVLDEKTLNDQVAVRRFARTTFRSLMREFARLTFMASCHLRKTRAGGANDLATRVAGSVQIRGAFDAVIGLVGVGRDAFMARSIKRSRSGGDFDQIKVQIVGAPVIGTLRLENLGSFDLQIGNVRGAAKAVMDFMRKVRCKTELKDIVGAINYSQRAVETACKKLSESDPPRLVRCSEKPASYDLSPDKNDLEGVD